MRNGGKMLSAGEIEERRKKGLCFWCASKYTPGHKCARTQLYQIMVEGAEDEVEPEVFLDCEEVIDLGHTDTNKEEGPILSLSALWGAANWETMRLKIRLQGRDCVALVDTGSTHNFLSISTAKTLRLVIDRKSSLRVAVANGNVLNTLGQCHAVDWEVQRHCFTTEFLILPLQNCDAVLGIQWLTTLGDIKWNFAELQMEFKCRGENVCLAGMQPGQLQVTTATTCEKLLKNSKSPCTAALWLLNPQLELKGEMNSVPQEIQLILKKFSGIFEEPKGLPPDRGHEHKIELVDERVAVKVKPYRHPAYQKDEIERLIGEMLESGVIRNSNSPFSSPIVMVKKKDGGWRMCVDYRKLNQLTVKDCFPMPVIEELLDELGKAMFFSKLDLRSGYHQIRMREADIHKTTFRTHEGHYEFLVMPFGLTNAPATFQGLMNKVFRSQLKKYTLVFFDDILVYSPDWNSHLSHLKEVLQILQANQLFVKLSKCCFGAVEVEYLGYIISRGGVKMDQSKVKSILDWPIPSSVKELRGFLGLSGYYRRFVKNYESIAKPLTELLKKGGWKWGKEELTAYEALKQVVTTAPVLALPDFTSTFVVETDASDVGVGAVLSQKGRPLAFFSKSLGVKHQGLSVYEKEMLAVLMAVKKWTSYLVGKHFIIRTDHQSLKFLAAHQAITPFQQKWVVKMMGYSYEVQYRKGATNLVADCLSRRPESGSIMAMGVSSMSTELMNRISNSWQTDDKCLKIIKEIEDGSSRHSKYSWDGQTLKRRDKLVVGKDSALRGDFLKFFHESVIGGHSGAHATMRRMTTVLYWKGLKREVKNFVRECVTCQRCKGDLHHPRGLLQPLSIPESIWSSISMDFIEGLPTSRNKNSILVVVNRLSKYGHFVAISHPFTARDIAQTFLENVFKLHGLSKEIVCDRDKIFMRLFWKELMEKLGVTVNASTAYHPQSDGQTERVNQCVETYLRCMTGERPKEWASWLHLAEWWYNTTFHTAIQVTPYQAVYGQLPPVHLPYIAGESLVAAVDRSLQQREAAVRMLKFHMKRAQDRMKSQADKRRVECEFQVGDKVFLKLQPYRQQSVATRGCLKLSPKWFGPFEVTDKVGKVAYRLKLPLNSQVHPVFHVSQLKKRVGPHEIVQQELPVIDPDGSISKEPLRIIDRRIGKRGNRAVTEVLVEWSNSFPEDATWEVLHSLLQQFPQFNP
ncbi:hypothetical protein HRI_001460100 [Hibiscus trionum]|uniref:Reverse transcriptase n=1 Tax=Hibiscus trionum TaxID=183268 RepID=A0A9W7HI52_HIBTR|nr:hypothetical protein HRI_001460100 [Hibiscus trionum]